MSLKMIFYLNVFFLSIMKHRVLNPSHDQVNLSEAYEAALLRTLNDIYSTSVVLKASELCFMLH
jgi:hypothetical protein